MINSGLKAEIMTFVKYYDSHGKAVGVVLQGGYARELLLEPPILIWYSFLQIK